MIIQVAKAQEAECYDGTTSSVIFAGELMKQTEELLEKGIHPTMIVRGRSHTETLAFETSDSLRDVAITAMTGKSAEDDGDHLADLCVKAAIRSKPVDVNIVVRPGAPVSESFFADGCIVDKSKMTHAMPDTVVGAKIALFDCELSIPALGQGVNMSFNDPNLANQYIAERKEELNNLAEGIIQAGANVVLSLKDIDPVLAEVFTRSGIYAARRVAASDLESVAVATGAVIVNNPADLEPADLGECESVEEKKFDLSPRPFCSSMAFPMKRFRASWCSPLPSTLPSKLAAPSTTQSVLFTSLTKTTLLWRWRKCIHVHVVGRERFRGLRRRSCTIGR